MVPVVSRSQTDIPKLEDGAMREGGLAGAMDFSPLNQDVIWMQERTPAEKNRELVRERRSALHTCMVCKDLNHRTGVAGFPPRQA